MMNNISERYYLIHHEKPFSLNEAYITRFSKGGKSWRRKSYEATLYQWLIQDTMALWDRLMYNDQKMLIPSSENLTGIKFGLTVWVPPKELRTKDSTRFKGRDVSNYIKLAEDAVFEYLGRTDGRTKPSDQNAIYDAASLHPSAQKIISFDDDWHILISLSYTSASAFGSTFSPVVIPLPGIETLTSHA